MTKPHATKPPAGVPRLREKQYLTVPEMAAVLQQPQRTVRYWCRTQALPAIQGTVRGRWLVPMSTLRERHALSDAALEDDGEAG